MLVHSHNDKIKLLPALPSQWPHGSVTGLRARGDYTVDIHWNNGELAKAIINAGERSTGTVKIVFGDNGKTLALQPFESAIVGPKDF